MKNLLLTLILSCYITSCKSSDIITINNNIEDATQKLQKYGYKTTEVSMMTDPDSELNFWKVEEGILMIRFNVKNDKIESMTYDIESDILIVKEFNLKTKEILIPLEKPN